MACTDTGTLRADLLALLGKVAASLTREDGGLILGLMFAMRADPELAAAVREQMVADKHRHGERLVAQARARGEYLRPDSAELLSELLPALMFTHPLLHGTSIDRPPPAHRRRRAGPSRPDPSRRWRELQGELVTIDLRRRTRAAGSEARRHGCTDLFQRSDPPAGWPWRSSPSPS